MKNTRCLRRLINDPRICILLPVDRGYRATSALRAGHMSVGDELGRTLLEGMWMGMGIGFTGDGDSYACSTDSRIARIDVSHGSSIRLYDSVCAMDRAGVSGAVLENSRNGTGSVAVRGAQDLARLIDTLASVRWDPDFVIAARINASKNGDYSVLRRHLRDCADAGADLLFVDGSIPTCELRKLVREVPKGICVDLSGLDRPHPALGARLLQDLQGMGVAAVVFPAVCQGGRSGMHTRARAARRAFGSKARIRNRGGAVRYTPCSPYTLYRASQKN